MNGEFPYTEICLRSSVAYREIQNNMLGEHFTYTAYTHSYTRKQMHAHTHTQDQLVLDLFSSHCLVWLEAEAGTHPVLFASLLAWREFAHLVALAQVNILM